MFASANHDRLLRPLLFQFLVIGDEVLHGAAQRGGVLGAEDGGVEVGRLKLGG